MSSDTVGNLRWNTFAPHSEIPATAGRSAKILPASKTATVEGVLFSNAYQIALLDRQTVLTDTVNGIFPFPLDRGRLEPVTLCPFDGPSTPLRSRWNNYYHTLIDLLPRFTQLHRPFFRNHGKINLLVPGGLTAREAFYLDRLGIPDNVIVQNTSDVGTIRVPQYLLISWVTAQGCGWVPAEYLEMLKTQVCPQRARRRSNRVLISRQQSHKRRIANFDEVAAAISRLGFEAVVLEDLSPLEQVELFFDAEAVVGSHGAGLTNLLFSDRVGVVEIFPSDLDLEHYEWLCQCMGHPYRRVVASKDREASNRKSVRAPSAGLASAFTDVRDAHVIVDPTQVIAALREIGVT